jgi:hypothetical protein
VTSRYWSDGGYFVTSRKLASVSDAVARRVQADGSP